ncbi:MAG: outer membrane protein transport protein [Bacteroidales bacterium]|nr:outer membrane protein transport protein [Bacteroidales bacterium]
MKKTLLLLSVFILTSAVLYGGGIVTNTNQSASWVRMPARTATLDLDATYYNPAGLSLLPSNGIFISLNNQVIGQKRTITSTYNLLNESEYTGEVSAPIFPSIYAGYKTEKFAVSFGFMPLGGGGGATYDNGVPSFEYPLTDLVPALALLGVNDYRADIFFEGTSVFYGYQLNFSYKISDMLSVALGGRYIMAKETYAGHLKDIEVYNYLNNSDWTRADVIMTGFATSAATGGSNLQAAIDGGILQAGDPASLTVVGNLMQLGIDATGFTNAQAVAGFQTAAATYTARATVLGDQEADAVKKGSGITPIISVDFHPSDMLNIAVRYEHNTKLVLKNETEKDIIVGFTPTGTPVTQFPDGAEANLDIPGTISLGVAVKPINKLLVSADMYYYLEKSADWEGRQDSLDANGFELALGLQYNLTEKLAVSGGFLYTKPGTTPAYNNDLSFNVQSSMFGLGGSYKLNDMIEINLGGAYTIYKDGEKDLTRNTLNFTETYDKSTWIVSAGVNLFFGK